MSDIMFPIETGGVPYQTTEHYLRRVLTGDIRSVRNRLIAALEGRLFCYPIAEC